jgi:hypothetical protein
LGRAPPIIDGADVEAVDMSGNLELPFLTSATPLAKLRRLDIRNSSIEYVSDSLFRGAESASVEIEADVAKVLNLASEADPVFGDVCCQRRVSSDGIGGAGADFAKFPKLAAADGSAVFMCDSRHLRLDDSVDSVMEPWFNYQGPSLKAIFPHSFHGEAATSASECARECTSIPQCTFFTWDGRWKNSQPRCLIKSNNFGRVNVEKWADNFAGNISLGNPGYVSGYPPRTRAAVYNATVKLSQPEVITEEESTFVLSYEVALGARPHRGSVWLTPEPSTGSPDFTASFSPGIVVFDPSNWQTPRPVTITFLRTDAGTRPIDEAMTILHRLEACDKSFSHINHNYIGQQLHSAITIVSQACDKTFSHINQQDSDLEVRVRVVLPSRRRTTFSTIWILVGCAAACLLLMAGLSLAWRKHKDKLQHVLSMLAVEALKLIVALTMETGDLATDAITSYKVIFDAEFEALYSYGSIQLWPYVVVQRDLRRRVI